MSVMWKRVLTDVDRSNSRSYLVWRTFPNIKLNCKYAMCCPSKIKKLRTGCKLLGYKRNKTLLDLLL